MNRNLNYFYVLLYMCIPFFITYSQSQKLTGDETFYRTEFSLLGNTNSPHIKYDKNPARFHDLFVDEVISFSNVNGKRKHNYFYDGEGRVKESEIFNATGKFWIPSWNIKYEYNESGSLGSESVYTWENDKWDLFGHIYYFYREGNLIHYDQVLNMGADTQKVYEQNYYYDSGKLSSTESRAMRSGVMENNYLHLFSYNDFGVVDTQILKSWNSDKWQNETLQILHYDKNNKITLVETKQWGNGKWENDARISVKYQNLYKNVYGYAEIYINGVWEEMQKFEETYDHNGLLQSASSQFYVSGEWRDGDYHINISGPRGFEDHIQAYSAEVKYKRLTGVKEDKINAEGYSLTQNYPNPFNPSTNITYYLPEAGHVVLKVYDTLGKEVAVLANGQQSEGEHTVTFDAAGLSSGIYYYRFIAGNYSSVKKMCVIK